MKKIFVILFVLFASCSSNKGAPNILLYPKAVSIDATTNRLFVVDAQDNNLSLIDLTENKIVGGEVLLDEESALTLPQLPQDLVAVNLDADTTRLFTIGNGPSPRNQIVVFDYDSTNGLQAAAISPVIVGDLSTDADDLLSGLAYDATTSTLFVSNHSDDVVRAYDVTTGTEKSGSPISVNSQPSKMGVDSTSRRLFVSSLGENSVSVIDLDDLTLAADSVDVGSPSVSVAAATNDQGTVLFVVNPIDNEVRVIHPDLADLTLSSAIGSPITPPAAGVADSASNLLTGAATQIKASVLADGTMVGALTQSTGDLGFVNVSADLSSFTQSHVSVLNGQGAFALDILNDDSGNGSVVYFAAPGGSAVSYVDLNTQLYVGQIL